MDSNSNESDEDGLPEIYLSPSKGTTPKNYDESDSRNWLNLTLEEETISISSGLIIHDHSNFDPIVSKSHSDKPIEPSNENKELLLGSMSEKLSQMHIFKSKEIKRGKTPGSDSPRDIAASITNLKISLEKDDSHKYTKDNKSKFSQTKDFEIADKSGPIRAVEGADSNINIRPFMPVYKSDSDQDDLINITDRRILGDEVLQRKSPAGISTPENVPTTVSMDILISEDSYDRPPVLGQCEESGRLYQGNRTSRKDLGSSDGEDSDSIKKKYANKGIPDVSSIGSLSENTDSINTVLDMKRGPIQGSENLENVKIFPKPNFIVGGAISPRIGIQNMSVVNTKTKSGIRKSKADSKHTPPDSNYNKNKQVDAEHDSLTSAFSIESTQHPESSECITPPSVQSISSIASSKKLEWDSGADLGYSKRNYEVRGSSLPKDTLSTLERMAIGSYASFIRTEPEGTTNNSKSKGKLIKGSHRELKNIKQTKIKGNKNVGVGSITGSRVHEKMDLSTSDEVQQKPLSPKRKLKKGYRNARHVENKENLEIFKNPVILGKACSLSEINLPNITLEDNLKNKSTHSSTSAKIKSEHVSKSQSFDSKFNPSNKHSSVSSSTLVNSNASLPYYFISSVYENTNVKSNSLQNLQLDNRLYEEDNLEKEIESHYSDAEVNELVLQNRAQEILLDTLKCDNISSVHNENIDEYSMSRSEDVTANSASSTSLNKDSSVSLYSVNAALFSLSNKLKLYIDNLMKCGSFGNLSDYSKLQDYIEFVGIASNNDEEVRLKQSVADIIMRMFGDISKSELGESLTTLSTEVKSYISSDSSATRNISNSYKDADNPVVLGSKNDDIPSAFVCVPYHPTTASKSYFVALPQDEEDVSLDKTRKSSEEVTTHEVEENRDHQELYHSSSSKGIYQDRHGILHVAHQPPGYNSYIDSHLSESTSENENNKVIDEPQSPQYENDDNYEIQNLNEQRRHLPAVWTSTGSESAYETIRERHRNIGEALASSFEFYSTSPRDARVLGYVSSDNEKAGLEGTIPDQSEVSEISIRPRVSDVAGISRETNLSSEKEFFSSSGSNKADFLPVRTQRKPFRKVKYHHRHKTYSSRESEGASSNISVVQIKRQKYIRRIRKYIHTLHKLESILNPPSFESVLSVGSESSPTSKESNSPLVIEHQCKGYKKKDVISSGESSYISSNANISEGAAGDASFVIHRNSSIQMVDSYSSSSRSRVKSTHSNRISKGVSSKDSSPRHTSTLRKEKIKKQNKNEDLALENCAKFSDFRKLMASNSEPGELRPYRHLLPKGSQDLDDNKKNIAKVKSQDGKLISEIKQSINIEGETSHRKWNERLNYNNESTDIQSMTSNDLLKTEAKKQKDFSLPQHIAGAYGININEDLQESSSLPTDEVWKATNQEKKIQSHSIESTKQRNKILTKEFGQMFPSTCDLLNDSIPKGRTAETQTGSSLLQFQDKRYSQSQVDKEINKTIETMSSGSINDDAVLVEKLPENKVVTMEPKPMSLLEQMNERIKENAAKINASLEAYNKEFGKISSETSRISPPSSKLSSPKRRIYTPESSQLTERSSQVAERRDKHSWDDELDAQKPFVASEDAQKVRANMIKISKSKNGLHYTVTVHSKKKSKGDPNKSLVEELIEMNKENQILTLQEALALAKPKYINEAEKRRMLIRRKQTIRQELQAHNRDILAELPDNLKTPNVLCKFLYKSSESPLFSYKAMREQNRKLYQLLPEARKPGILRKKEGKTKTNRLMSTYYSQKLRGKVLKGKVSHAHRNVVTPVR